MSANHLPTIDQLRQSLRYDNGKLYWLDRPRSHFKTDRAWRLFLTRDSGNEAGYLIKTHSGYRHFITLYLRRYQRSRLVWAIMNGSWPTKMIDHENRITSDDRIGNLREATSTQNNMNRSIGRNNASGLKGVSWYQRGNKWKAQIMIDKKVVHLGYYFTKEDAHSAYCKSAKEAYGEFAFTGEQLNLSPNGVKP